MVIVFPVAGQASAPEPDRPPRIVDHAKSQNVHDGEPVTLSCRYVVGQEYLL